jgi:ABC-type phosphate transport system substrate-binding protein
VFVQQFYELFPKNLVQDSSGTVRKIVEQTPGAISYLAFSYMDDSTVALSIDGVEPKEEHVRLLLLY